MFCPAGAVVAQSYSIDWHKIAGGGNAGSGGTFSLSGTIGQHDAQAIASGGPYAVTGGFWAVAELIQTPGAPTLCITRSGSAVTIFWQDVSGWSLQQNSSLSSPAGWSASGSASLSNGTNYLTLSNPTGKLFFRLTHP